MRIWYANYQIDLIIKKVIDMINDSAYAKMIYAFTVYLHI